MPFLGRQNKFLGFIGDLHFCGDIEYLLHSTDDLAVLVPDGRGVHTDGRVAIGQMRDGVPVVELTIHHALPDQAVLCLARRGVEEAVALAAQHLLLRLSEHLEPGGAHIGYVEVQVHRHNRGVHDLHQLLHAAALR